MCGAVVMDTTPALPTLTDFRRAAYDEVLGHRKDSLFELKDAVLVSPGRANLAHLSLAPAFRRGWPSAPDALADGRLDPDAGRRLVHGCPADPPAPARPLWAQDGTVWPRPAAKTVADRTYGHRPSPGIPQSGLVPAWEYEWLVAVPEARGSWVLPLDVRRRGPGAGTPTEVAAEQCRAALALRPAGAPRPVGVYDSGYDPVGLARAQIPADLLVRLRTRRKFSGPPGPYRGRGPRPKHGAVFKLWDERTHPAPDRSAAGQDPTHGRVEVDVWQQQHVRGAHDVPFTVVRVRVEHLPRRAKAPAPLWLAWIGGDLPEDLLDLWRWYARRFTVEHGFRFLKQELGWTTARPGHPEAADRWSWLLALGLWELWLARALAADRRLPWERPLPPERLTPGRVRRALPALFLAAGTPARAPRRRGKSPGRRPGTCPGPRERHPVARRRPQRAA
jgi:hypothetical protein